MPLDHDEPDGPTIDLAVQRLSAAIPGERIGSLFLNFGGPGGTSSSIFPGYAGLLAAGGFADRFDLVTWDTRGTVGSAPLACTSADLDAAADAVGLVDPSDGFDDELGDEREGFEFVIDCASRTPDLLDHIGTVSVAKDLDLLRQAVGDDALNYLGYSYGSEIGWVHATLFPDTIRTMILDGIVDPVSQRSGFVDQYAAFERTLEFFDEWCADVADCDSLLSGERLLDAVDRVAAGAAKVGKTIEDVDRPELLVCSLSDDDPEEAIMTGKSLVAYYLGTEPHIMEASGADPELVERVQEIVGWPATEADYRKAAHLIPDELVSKLMAVGTTTQCRDAVAEYIDAGITCPILYPIMDDIEPVIDAFGSWKP